MLALLGTLVVGEHFTGAVVTVMLATGRSLEAWAAGRAERDLRVLLARAPKIPHRYVATEIRDAPLDEVAVGDVLLVQPGEVISVDGTVHAGPAIIDDSAITGEPLPPTPVWGLTLGARVLAFDVGGVGGSQLGLGQVVDGWVNAGEILVGEILVRQQTPFSAANLLIGCPASLPTSGFAEVSSGITVEAFLKRTAVARADDRAAVRMAPSVVSPAEHEGFPAHTPRCAAGRPGPADGCRVRNGTPVLSVRDLRPYQLAEAPPTMDETQYIKPPVKGFTGKGGRYGYRTGLYVESSGDRPRGQGAGPVAGDQGVLRQARR